MDGGDQPLSHDLNSQKSKQTKCDRISTGESSSISYSGCSEDKRDKIQEKRRIVESEEERRNRKDKDKSGFREENRNRHGRDSRNKEKTNEDCKRTEDGKRRKSYSDKSKNDERHKLIRITDDYKSFSSKEMNSTRQDTRNESSKLPANIDNIYSSTMDSSKREYEISKSKTAHNQLRNTQPEQVISNIQSFKPISSSLLRNSSTNQNHISQTPINNAKSANDDDSSPNPSPTLQTTAIDSFNWNRNIESRL